MIMQIFLLSCSPNFSQHFYQASWNLFLLVLFPSLEFMYEEIIWMTVHPTHLPRDLGRSPSSGMPLLVRGGTASNSLFQKGGGELSSMWLCHHPDPPGHHPQWHVKSSAMQIPAVSNSEITLSSSLSCSLISLSEPETIFLCSTLWYSHTYFLLYAPITSLRPTKSLFCVLGCLRVFFGKTVRQT